MKSVTSGLPFPCSSIPCHPFGYRAAPTDISDGIARLFIGTRHYAAP